METPDQVPYMTKIYRLSPDVYDQFVADLDNVRGDMPKLRELFAKPSPFTTDCD